MNTDKYVVKKKYYGTKTAVKEIYESFDGWIWVVVNYEAKKSIGYGFVHGIEDEWGTFYMDDLNKNKFKIWPVPKSNWWGVEYVEKVA